jgi:Na+-driven multidrug efflux pump
VPGDVAVINSGATFLRTTSVAWGFLGLQMCLIGVLRATCNTIIPMILALVSQWVLQFPIAFVLSHYTNMAEKGIWLAFPISTTVTALITLAIYAKGDWKKKQIINKPNEIKIKAEDEMMTGGITNLYHLTLFIFISIYN